MFINIRRVGNQQSVDKSLQNELSKSKEDNELKDKKIKNLEDRLSILATENLNIADQRNDLAILLKQKL